MDMRGAVRRCEAALVALSQPAPALEAALAGAGPPGSPAVLAVLAQDDHALLRAAVKERRIAALAPLVTAYGGAPDAPPDAGLLKILEADLDVSISSVFLSACYRGEAAAVAALLGVYRRAGGRLAAALARRRRRALLNAARNGADGLEVTRLLLAEIGAPGSAPVLEVLAEKDHHLLRRACGSRGKSADTAAAVVEAYGLAGGPAILGALAAGDHAALNAAVQMGSPEALTAVLRGYGPAGCCEVRAAMERGRRGYISEEHLYLDIDGDSDDDGGGEDDSGGGNAHVLHYCFNEAFSFSWRPHDANAKLPLLLAALGEGPDHPTALRALADYVAVRTRQAERYGGHGFMWVQSVPQDSPLARLALLSPAAWAMGGAETARTLLSAPVWEEVGEDIAAVATALEDALPAAVFDPVSSYMIEHPWLLFRGSWGE